MHTESDFAPVVARYVHEHGIGRWDELFAYAESILPLTDYDLEQYKDRTTLRYQSKIHNLKSHRHLISIHADIIQIDGGFATAQFAKDNNIPERTGRRTGSRTTPRVRIPKMDTRIGEKYIRAVFKQHIPSLKIYDRTEVYADFKTLTVHEFGTKYNMLNENLTVKEV